jgi:phage terminase large subunit-like protein
MPGKLADAGQTYRHMNGACKEMERVIAEGRLSTAGNPVARWMASNTVADANQDDLIRPSRKKSSEKIDGIVALLQAWQRAVVAMEEPEVSFYSFADN